MATMRHGGLWASSLFYMRFSLLCIHWLKKISSLVFSVYCGAFVCTYSTRERLDISIFCGCLSFSKRWLCQNAHLVWQTRTLALSNLGNFYGICSMVSSKWLVFWQYRADTFFAILLILWTTELVVFASWAKRVFEFVEFIRSISFYSTHSFTTTIFLSLSTNFITLCWFLQYF